MLTAHNRLWDDHGFAPPPPVRLVKIEIAMTQRLKGRADLALPLGKKARADP